MEQHQLKGFKKGYVQLLPACDDRHFKANKKLAFVTKTEFRGNQLAPQFI